MSDAPSHLTMPKEEIRTRLVGALKIFPKARIAKLMKVRPHDITLFAQNRGQDSRRKFGVMLLRRLAKICLQIETGELRHNGKMVGRGSKIWVDEPIRPPLIVHRVMFGKLGATPKMVKGEAPKQETMPSFASLFAGKPLIRLPKVAQNR